MSKFRIDDVEQAIIDLLTTKLPDVKVRGASLEDFDSDGNLITTPAPTILVLFDREDLPTTRDQTRLTYQSMQEFAIFVGSRNLRSTTRERESAYTLISRVKDELAGARVTLEDGSKTPPFRLSGVEPFQISKEGSWYVVKVTATGIPQFPGTNA